MEITRKDIIYITFYIFQILATAFTFELSPDSSYLLVAHNYQKVCMQINYLVRSDALYVTIVVVSRVSTFNSVLLFVDLSVQLYSPVHCG